MISILASYFAFLGNSLSGPRQDWRNNSSGSRHFGSIFGSFFFFSRSTRSNTAWPTGSVTGACPDAFLFFPTRTVLGLVVGVVMSYGIVSPASVTVTDPWSSPGGGVGDLTCDVLTKNIMLLSVNKIAAQYMHIYFT